MTEDLIPLQVYGNVEREHSDDPSVAIRPQEVTIPAPPTDAHVAIVRTNAPVSFLAIYEPQDRDGFTSDIHLPGATDGPREFWLDADCLEDATRLHVNTRDGQDLSSVDVRVEYRGWRGRVKKLVRDCKQRIRAERRLWQRGDPE